MINSALISVDFIRADGTPIPGLVAVDEKNRSRTSLSVDEQAAILDAGSFERIDYIYFRRFSDGRSSQVAAYIVDNSSTPLDENALSKLHAQVWLQGRAPLLYIAWPTRIDVLACAREPDFWQEEKKDRRYNPVEKFHLDTLSVAGNISKEMERFSAFRLADGTFWDEPRNRKLANHDKAAHQALIQAVVETDRDLDGENKPVLRRLLLLMILIKYLEDRGVFPNQGWFGRFHKGAKNFFDILKNGTPDEVYDLFRFLDKDKFNGEVFDLSRLRVKKLTKKDLNTFARLVEARTLDRQRYLWEQFSFKHLPVEIISHLYQRFVQGGHGAVYTPPFLASLLLDQAMPYDKLTGKECVLDPACGSGVFLVGAFRRLINFWRSRHKWKKPDVDTLKKILRKSIFGVEMDPFAVDLTAFSLSLALCDALPTIDIWGKLKFDRLRESNLFKADFFQLLLDSQEDKSHFINKGFNVVIGNPPFESQLTPAAEKVDQNAFRKDSSRGKVPSKQIAYLFLEQLLSIVRPNEGRICLIQPSNLIYYQKPRSFFTNRICKRYCVDTILDFTSIRKLYEKDTKTIAIHALAKAPQKDHWINHWTFRRTTSTHERICFELDHYDCHRISQNKIEDNPFIWRANLLGGGRLHEISNRFRYMQTLKQYCMQNKWVYGEGFKIGNGKNPAPFLTGKKYLPTEEFTSDKIDETKFIKLTETHFESPRKKYLYIPPLILIRELDSLPTGYWDKYNLAYKREIVGIHAPRSDEPEFKSLYDLLITKKEFYRFFTMIHGSRSLIAKQTQISKEDIDLIPIPENSHSLDLSFWEKAIQNDVLKYIAVYVRRGQNSDLLRKKANGKELETYSKMFCRMLGSVYDNLQAGDPIFLHSLICQPFYFGEEPKLEWLTKGAEEPLKKLIYYDKHEHLRTVRVFRYYAENVLLIVKPDRLRYWIRSTAIRDADETLVDLHQQGY